MGAENEQGTQSKKGRTKQSHTQKNKRKAAPKRGQPNRGAQRNKKTRTDNTRAAVLRDKGAAFRAGSRKDGSRCMRLCGAPCAEHPKGRCGGCRYSLRRLPLKQRWRALFILTWILRGCPWGATTTPPKGGHRSLVKNHQKLQQGT